jgi:uncharacterized protein (DUF433 family)
MISKNNIWLYGASGRAGNLVVKNYSGKIVISKVPDMSRRKLTEKQKEYNVLMKLANMFAQGVTENPGKKQEASEVLGVPYNKVYRALIKEYVKRKGEIHDLLPSFQADKYKNTAIKHEHYINTSEENGKPVLKGKDVSVEIILQRLSRGLSFTEILEEYPQLHIPDILAALSYASEKIAGK